MTTYEEYSRQSSSEKIGLVILRAKSRLMGWTLYSGSVYQITLESKVIETIADSGTDYTAKDSIGAIVAGSYYYDRQNGVLYLQASDSSNPNSRYIILTEKLHFSNVPVILPHDLNTGFEVEYLPYLTGVNVGGVEINSKQYQLGIAIEGSGSIVLKNDKAFWQSRFDQLVFDNASCEIYSWSRDIDVSEVKLLYTGIVISKIYNFSNVTFALRDTLFKLRQPLELPNIGALSGIEVPLNFNQTKQRLVYGKVEGFRPQNIDQLDRTNGYPLTGTISSIDINGLAINLTGGSALNEVNSNDTIVLDYDGSKVVATTGRSDNIIYLQEPFKPGDTKTEYNGSTISIIPRNNKDYINRVWKITEHAIMQPIATIQSVIHSNAFIVDTVEDFEEGDEIELNSELGTVTNISGNYLFTSGFTALAAISDEITKIAVTDVKINSTQLTYLSDYTYDADNGELILEPEAEVNNTSTTKISGSNFLYKAGTSIVQVIGTGTSFTKELNPESYFEGVLGNTYKRIYDIISDTELYIFDNNAGDLNKSNALAKVLGNFNPLSDILTCTTLGATEDGTKEGTFIKTAPQAVKDLLIKAGLSDRINTTSFTEASERLELHPISFVEPLKYNARTTRPIRTLIDTINRSVFGALIQDDDFKFAYKVLEPIKPFSSITKFTEQDILALSFANESDNVVKDIVLNYNRREYDDTLDEESFDTESHTSPFAEYLVGTTNKLEVNALLRTTDSARIIATRWLFLLELGRYITKLRTKLQASGFTLIDPIDVKHALMFERFSSLSKRFLGQVHVLKKTHLGVDLEADDLAGAYARVASITGNDASAYTSASEEEKIYNGYITDQYGLINNDSNTIYTNLIW